MAEEKDEVNFTDKKAEVVTFDRFKGSKGQIARIAFLSTNLLRAYSHFTDQQNFKVIRCFSDKATKAACCEKYGPPTQRFGAVIYRYMTDDKGEMPDKNKCSGKVMLWSISESRYEELRNLASQWPLLDSGPAAAQHDILANCTEEKFQKMSWTPCPEAQWKRSPEWYKKLKELEILAAERLKLVLGRKLTAAEIADLFGARPTGGMSPTAGVVNLDDVLTGDVGELPGVSGDQKA